VISFTEEVFYSKSIDFFQLKVRAHFYGLREQTADCTVNITVVRNEYPPVFDQQSYTASLMENFPLGDSILRVHATDQDKYVSHYVR